MHHHFAAWHLTKLVDGATVYEQIAASKQRGTRLQLLSGDSLRELADSVPSTEATSLLYRRLPASISSEEVEGHLG